MDELDFEIASYDLMKNELESQHMGKWVVFYNRSLAGIYDSFDKAAADAAARFGRGPYLIREIGEDALTLPPSIMYHLI
jgi:hypothetical protein